MNSAPANPVSAPQPTPAPAAMVDLNFEPRILEKTLDYQGKKIVIHHYAPTRAMRNKAMTEAVDTYRREHPGLKEGEGLGGDPFVLEKELACRMIKWWNIPQPPRIVWDNLPVELGDEIVKVLEIGELFALNAQTGPEGQQLTKLSQAAETAKNS
jgi:hypothetical protein